MGPRVVPDCLFPSLKLVLLPMRYPPGQKEEKRKQLLKASGALVKEGGFAATGIDALASAAGVTSGAFYSNFGSKSELLKAIIDNELLASRDLWAGNPHESPQQWIDFELDRYLSLSHIRHPGSGCVLPAIGAEIARADQGTRELYEQELRKGVDILAQRLGSEELAWVFVCQLVGTLMIARALPSEASQKMVLEAAKGFLRSVVAGLGK